MQDFSKEFFNEDIDEGVVEGRETIEKLEKDLHDMRSLLKVSKTLYENLELDKVLETIVYSCIGLTFSKEASIFLQEDYGGSSFVLRYSKGSSESEKMENKITIKDAKPLVQLFKNKKKSIYISSIDRNNAELSKIIDTLSILNPRIIVPLVSNQGDVVGFLLLGEKLNNARYSENDLNSIEILSGFAAISVENARLYKRATQDFMTGLYNHGFFQVALDDELEVAKLNRKPLSLIIFDIDNFKSFNDTYGHQTGDMVLRNIGSIIRETVKEDGHENVVTARYGGEEFAVIMPQTDWKECEKLAENLRKNIESHEFIDKNNVLKVTCSFGVSTWTHQRPMAKPSFIDEADAASYASKQKGKNTVTVYDSAKSH